MEERINGKLLIKDNIALCAFFKDNEFLGTAHVPEASEVEERQIIADRFGWSDYNRICFIGRMFFDRELPHCNYYKLDVYGHK